jgi:hypothetical protein
MSIFIDLLTITILSRQFYVRSGEWSDLTTNAGEFAWLLDFVRLEEPLMH